MATQLKPTKDKFTKTQIQDQIAESTCITRKQVAAVLDCLGEVIEAHLTKNAVGEFVLPGLMMISTVRKPAVKAHKGINPFTKEEVLFKAKPASTAVKVRPLKGLKDIISRSVWKTFCENSALVGALGGHRQPVGMRGSLCEANP